MHILIVDDDQAIADYLVETIGERFPSSWIESAVTASEARMIADRMDELDVLLTDVVLGETDGFSLCDELLPRFPGMQTVFVTGHDLDSFNGAESGRCLIRKPIDPEAIVTAISNAHDGLGDGDQPGAEVCAFSADREDSFPDTGAAMENQYSWQTDVQGPRGASIPNQEKAAEAEATATLLGKQGFTGKLDQFQLVDIIQLCCLSGRTGRLTITKGLNSGVLFFSRNNIVHAACGEAQGEEAAFRIVAWKSGSFSFAEDLLPEKQTIYRSWENLMMESAVEGDETGDLEAAAKKQTGLIGQTLGAYHVVRKLGSGLWGGTYEARIAGSDDKVTLKVLAPEKADDPVLVQQFIADANTKCNLTHPHMVRIPHGVAESEGLYFYPREYVEGESLADYRAHGKSITEEQAVTILRTVSETLLYLNHRKIPHSPLLASSIFLTPDGSVRLGNIATSETHGEVVTQTEIRDLSRTVNTAMQGGVAVSQPLRQLLTRMLVPSTSGVPSWGALLQATRTFGTLKASSKPVPVPVAVPRATAAPDGRVPRRHSKKPKLVLILCSAIGVVALLVTLLLLVF